MADLLACPVCKTGLKLGLHSRHDDEIASGELRCPKCRETDEIQDGIPELLPPDYCGRPASSVARGN